MGQDTYKEPEYWYRFIDGGRAKEPYIFLDKFVVVKHTPKGVQLGYGGETRFVLREGYKRWACPTIEEAWESFLARKKRQRKILKVQLEYVEKVIERTSEGLERATSSTLSGGSLQFDDPAWPFGNPATYGSRKDETDN